MEDKMKEQEKIKIRNRGRSMG